MSELQSNDSVCRRAASTASCSKRRCRTCGASMLSQLCCRGEVLALQQLRLTRWADARRRRDVAVWIRANKAKVGLPAKPGLGVRHETLIPRASSYGTQRNADKKGQILQ
eukprot:5696711-Pleurochrysis_carterae.AAC.3